MNALLTNDQVSRCGPLHGRDYLKLLEERGYKQSTTGPDSLLRADRAKATGCAISMRRSWFDSCAITCGGDNSRLQAKRAALGRLPAMLRNKGCIAPAKSQPRSPAQQLLDACEHYLRYERAFANDNCGMHHRHRAVFVGYVCQWAA